MSSASPGDTEPLVCVSTAYLPGEDVQAKGRIVLLRVLTIVGHSRVLQLAAVPPTTRYVGSTLLDDCTALEGAWAGWAEWADGADMRSRAAAEAVVLAPLRPPLRPVLLEL